MSQEVYRVTELEPGCWAIEEQNVRCFLFESLTAALLVDSGFGSGDLRGLVSSLTDKEVILVNTHADRDHVGGNEQLGIPMMHPSEYDRYRQNGGRGAKPLWEGDVIDIGGRSFEVILIPGHTPGSIALLDEGNSLLISGDTVQDSRIFMFKQGRNMPAYMESLRKLQAMSGRFDNIYPSHGTVPLLTANGVIHQLIEDGEAILGGGVDGVAGELFGAPIWEYRMEAAVFLCDRMTR